MKTLHAFFAATTLAVVSLSSLSELSAGPLTTDFSQKSKPATIKVLIARHADGAHLEAKGRYQIYNPVDGLQITSGAVGNRHPIFAQENGIKWGELLPGIFQMRIVPGDSQSSVLVNGIQYKGCVELYVIDGKINIVNEVDIENYLKSTMATQFTHKLSDEVMESIAIVERTNASYIASRSPDVFWHVDAQEVGYQGYALTFQNLQVDRALENTRHVVMSYQNAPFAATWTKDSAGKTADFATIFRKNIPVPHGVEAAPAARDRDKHTWSFLLGKAQLATLAKMQAVTSVDLYVDKKSNKVYGMKLSDGTRARDIDFASLQKMLGKNKLLSNDFTIRVKGESIMFSGFGEGPGVGLCLYSAQAMAQEGNNAQKILTTFFPDAKLENIKPALVHQTEAIVDSSNPPKNNR
jgi:stage II sporulation protein D